MNHSQQLCDSELLENFLQGGISERRERELTSHLDECPSCQLELEAKAAEPVYWREIGEMLMGGFSRHRELALLGSRAPSSSSLSSQTQSVLATLAPTDDPQMLGRLGAYEISGVIGAGGMGVVLKAHDRSLDRTVAIKVMSPHLASCGSARTRFAREAKAAAAVLHPNVIAIHGVANDKSLPYLVMPYVRGESLQKRIDSEGPLPLGDVLRIGAQIAAGLAAAHAQGLVHRDIKPANILLEDGVERVAITDFGLARAVDDASMTRSGVIAGTPQYMSPEQARGEPIDQRSDLFSLGSVLYAVCTGRPPFRAETTYGVMRRITDDEPTAIREINPDVPEWLCAIIAELLAKRPDERFASAGEVAELLEACLAHVRQPTTVPLPDRWLSLRESSVSRQPLGARPRFPRKPPASAVRLIMAVACAMSLVFAGILIVLELNKGTLTIACEADDVPIRIVQGDSVVEELTVTKAGASLRVAAGKYIVEIDGKLDGITVNDGTVTLQRGEQTVVSIVRSPAAASGMANDKRSRGTPGAVDQRQSPQAVTQTGDSASRLEAQAGPAMLVQVFFQQPRTAKVTLTPGEDRWIVVPGSVSFPSGQTFRFKLSEVPNYQGVELSGSFELASSNALTQKYLEHNAIPIQFTNEDMDQAIAGNMVTKVIYLPNADNAEMALAGVDSLVAHRLDLGVDPITAARRRGAILAVFRLGNRNEPAAIDGAYERAIQGTVITATDECVEISLGQDDGITMGMQFVVVREGKHRGVIAIAKVDADQSVGRIMQSEHVGELIQAGDQVIGRIPADPSRAFRTSRSSTRHNRWEIRYSADPQRYARILDFFGIELGIADVDSQEATYLSNLSHESPAVRHGPTFEETRLFLTNSDSDSMRIARSFLDDAGIKTRGRRVIWFYPRETETLLAALEATAADVSSIDLVHKTVFGVRQMADRFEFYVISQSKVPATSGTLERSDQPGANAENATRAAGSAER